MSVDTKRIKSISSFSEKRGNTGPSDGGGDVDFKMYNKVMDAMEDFENTNIDPYMAAVNMLALLENDQIGELDAVIDKAKMFVENCADLGPVDKFGADFVGVPVKDLGEDSDESKRARFYTKDKKTGEVQVCMPASRKPQPLNQMQRIARMLQILEDKKSEFEGLQKVDRNMCEAATTASECGSRFGVDADGNEVDACDFYKINITKEDAQETINYTPNKDAVLAVKSHPDKFTKVDRNETYEGAGVCVPNHFEMRRRFEVYKERIAGLKAENSLLDKRLEELLGGANENLDAGGLLALNFGTPSKVTQHKLDAIKHTHKRKISNMRTANWLERILRSYLDTFQNVEIGQQLSKNTDSVCEDIRTTLGACAATAGCVVLEKPSAGSHRLLKTVPADRLEDPLRDEGDPLADVLGSTVCRAADVVESGLVERQREAPEPKGEPLPAFLSAGGVVPVPESAVQGALASITRSEQLRGAGPGLRGGLDDGEVRLVDASRLVGMTTSEQNWLVGLNDAGDDMSDKGIANTAAVMQVEAGMVSRVRAEFARMLADIRRLYEIVATMDQVGYQLKGGSCFHEHKVGRAAAYDANQLSLGSTYDDTKIGKYDDIWKAFQKDETEIIKTETRGDSLAAENACEFDEKAKKRELVHQLFLIIGQARRINKAMRAIKDDTGIEENPPITGGETDVYLTLCDIHDVYRQHLDDDGMVGKMRIQTTPGHNGYKAITTRYSGRNFDLPEHADGWDLFGREHSHLSTPKEATAKFYTENPEETFPVPIPEIFQQFAKNCFDMSMNIEKDIDTEFKFEEMFSTNPQNNQNLMGGSRERAELFGFVDNYVRSVDSRIVPGQLVLVHSKLLKQVRAIKLERLIFNTIGGPVKPHDWNVVLVTKVDDRNGNPIEGIQQTQMIDNTKLVDQNMGGHPLSGGTNDEMLDESRIYHVFNGLDDVSDMPPKREDWNMNGTAEDGTTPAWDETKTVPYITDISDKMWQVVTGNTSFIAKPTSTDLFVDKQLKFAELFHDKYKTSLPMRRYIRVAGETKQVKAEFERQMQTGEFNPPSFKMLDLTVLDALDNFTKLVDGKNKQERRQLLKDTNLELKLKRVTNPRGIVGKDGMVTVAMMLDGGGRRNLQLQKYSALSPGDLPFGGYIVQHKPHIIDYKAGFTPYDHQDEQSVKATSLLSAESAVDYWMPDDESQLTATTSGSNFSNTVDTNTYLESEF